MVEHSKKPLPKISGLVLAGKLPAVPEAVTADTESSHQLPASASQANTATYWFESLPRSKRGNLLVPISRLKLSPHQSRHVRTEERVEELKNTLLQDGQQEPITVYPGTGPNEGYLFVISGGTRLEASRRLGWTELESQVDDSIDQNDALGIVRISSIHNNTAIEADIDRAYTAKNLLEMNFTKEMIATAIGTKTTRDVTRLLSFFKLPPAALQLGAQKPSKFSAAFCEVLNSAADLFSEESLCELIKTAFAENWSIRELERRISLEKRQKARNQGTSRSRSRRLVLQEYKSADQKLGHLNVLDIGNGKQRIELDATLDHEIAVQLRDKIEAIFNEIIAEFNQAKANSDA